MNIIYNYINSNKWLVTFEVCNEWSISGLLSKYILSERIRVQKNLPSDSVSKLHWLLSKLQL